MRVLLVAGALPPMKCGIGDYTEKLAEALSRQPGLSVAVLTNRAADPGSNRRSFETLALALAWRWDEAHSLLAAVRGWRPDVVHMQFPSQGYGRQRLPWVFLLGLHLNGFRSVQTWHEYVVQTLTMPEIKNSLLYLPNAVTPGALVVVRPQYAEHMAGWYRRLLAHKRLRLIPNAPAIPVVPLTETERLAVQLEFAPTGKSLVAYFGFALPAKGIEQLFEIADPAHHHLMLMCDLRADDPYQARLLAEAHSPRWKRQTLVTGFLPAAEVGRRLAAAEAVVLPFREGGGQWNTSLEGAAQQGTFVLTTSREQRGYDAARNLYFAQPEDVDEMRRALQTYCGHRVSAQTADRWGAIAAAHLGVYNDLQKAVR
jgi:glycosyltransferase involved in cell wall biosynthesis